MMLGVEEFGRAKVSIALLVSGIDTGRVDVEGDAPRGLVLGNRQGPSEGSELTPNPRHQVMPNGDAELAEGGIEVVDARGRNAPAVLIRLGNVGTNRHGGSLSAETLPPVHRPRSRHVGIWPPRARCTGVLGLVGRFSAATLLDPLVLREQW
jgi:hypothetical protein